MAMKTYISSLLLLGVGILLAACRANLAPPLESVTCTNTPAVIPQPARLVATASRGFALPTAFSISTTPHFANEARVLAEAMRTDWHIPLMPVASNTAAASVLDLRETPEISNEGYRLRIADGRVRLEAGAPAGAFYGVQTLRQLVRREGDRLVIPEATIEDAPRFPWRALMIDPARHFWKPEDIRQYIEAMAQYKFNKLHLHLSDDQGWRLTMDQWPKLAEIASRRAQTDGDGKPHSGIYTREQLKDLVAFAAERHIEIIPEIDVPGHNAALLAAYPEFACFPKPNFQVRTTAGVSIELLCPANPKLYQLYADIYRELAAIFPSPYAHVGGDEAPLTRWKECPACAGLRQREGLDSPQREMGWFFGRMAALLAKEGKIPLFWYEDDVTGYPTNSIMYTWRLGKTSSVINLARKNGWQLIAAPGEHAYLDYPQKKGDVPHTGWMPTTTLEQTYRLDPGYGLAPDLQSHIIGVEGTLWGEEVRDLNRASYMTWPRGWALAEAGWSPMAARGWEKFKSKLSFHKQRFETQRWSLGPLPVETPATAGR